jgi:hypothetical protein
VEVEKAYYEAPPEFLGRQVWVRWDGRMVRLFNDRVEQVGAHPKHEPGKFSRCLGVRGLHGSIQEGVAYWGPRAAALGESAGRWAQRALDERGAEALRSLMALCHLTTKHRAAAINAACAKALAAASGQPTFREIKRLLEAGDNAPEQLQMKLRDEDPIIRPLSDYADFIRNQVPESDCFSPQTELITEPKAS